MRRMSNTYFHPITERCPECDGHWRCYCTVECAYCQQDVSPRETPSVCDEAAWLEIASEHLHSCEWVQTRAHRLGGES